MIDEAVGAVCNIGTGNATTPMVPSTARLLVQLNPAPGAGEIVIPLPPANGWLNTLNVLPATSAGPRFCTVNVLVDVPVNVPDTVTESFVAAGASDLLTRMN